MSYSDARKKRAKQAQRASHRNVQTLRPGARRHAQLAQQLAIEQRQEAGRAPSGGDKRSLLNDALERRICDHLRHGASLHDSAVMAGVGAKTVDTWRGKGVEDPDSRYGQFLEQTELARTEWKISAVKRINQSADWKALWKLLCARYPLEYRNYVSVSTEMSGPDGSPIPINMSGGVDFNVVLELSRPASQPQEEQEPQFRIVE